MNGAYAGQSHAGIRSTLALLRHFDAFLRSDCTRMMDPYDSWKTTELDKPAARRKLTWLINVAINRKAGVPDVPGRLDENAVRRIAYRVNSRVIVREAELGELRGYFLKRIPHRITRRGDDD